MRAEGNEVTGSGRRFSRRTLVGSIAGAGAAALIGRSGAQAAAIGESEANLRASVAGLDTVIWPADLGQTDLQVFFPETGHTLRGTFLDYWRAGGGKTGFGLPLSEPFALNGYYSQAFEKAILQYQPEYQWTEQPVLRAADIGAVLARANGDLANDAGLRRYGGGDRRSGIWTALDPNSNAVANSLAKGGQFYSDTGHTVNSPFLDWYQANDGVYYLGLPISQAFKKNGAIWQYFEGGALRQTDRGVGVVPLVKSALKRLGVDTTPVDGSGLPEYDEAMFMTMDDPNPIGSIYAPGRKWIDVSISQEQMWVYQGSTLITTSLVSTGLAPNFTSKGVFYIRSKTPKQTMKGFTNDTGEVVSTGDDAQGGDGLSAYDVPDVPDVMYFTLEGEALHGTYWHNNFGNPMSHGCINQPLDVAHFMYGWAPLGTMVWVHD